MQVKLKLIPEGCYADCHTASVWQHDGLLSEPSSSCHEVPGADATSKDLSQAWCAEVVVHCLVIKWSSGREADVITCNLNHETYFLLCYNFNYCPCIGRTLGFLCLFMQNSSICEVFAPTLKAAIAVGASLLRWSFSE